MRSKKIICAALTGVLALSAVMSGCGGTTTVVTQSGASSGDVSTASETKSGNVPEDGNFSAEYKSSEDKYRTFYEIFPYAFYDSNGDGIGDIKGITSKLDYLNDGDPSTTDDLGIEGIWLMPIMPSPSYHKYNISDYMDIDKSYGTLDDFKEFLEECHKRDIHVIIDLVLNHTSRTHQWFKNAKKEVKEGKLDGYAEYYHIAKDVTKTGWRGLGFDGWMYEAQFDSDMPDLNLKNEKVREEIEKIVKYWIDMGVDGFRLDAVKFFEETGTADSVEDLKWLYDYAKSVKDDVYMVGECWDSTSMIADFYKSGVDSYFNFADQGGTGRIKSAVVGQNASAYVSQVESWLDTIEENNPNAIDAPFISNHDTGRSAGFFTTNTARKLAAATYLLSPGNSFIYYGEEIAMTGTETDPDKRMGMYWSASDKTGYVPSIPGASNTSLPEQAVDEAQKDKDSLLNFYKRAIRLKSQNPEIARGDIKAVTFDEDKANNVTKATAGYVSTYNGKSVMVIYNTYEKGVTLKIPESTFKVKQVNGYLLCDSGDGLMYTPQAVDNPLLDIGGEDESSQGSDESSPTEVTLDGQTLTMPAYSVVVLGTE